MQILWKSKLSKCVLIEFESIFNHFIFFNPPQCLKMKEFLIYGQFSEGIPSSGPWVILFSIPGQPVFTHRLQPVRIKHSSIASEIPVWFQAARRRRNHPGVLCSPLFYILTHAIFRCLYFSSPIFGIEKQMKIFSLIQNFIEFE